MAKGAEPPKPKPKRPRNVCAQCGRPLPLLGGCRNTNCRLYRRGRQRGGA